MGMSARSNLIYGFSIGGETHTGQECPVEVLDDWEREYENRTNIPAGDSKAEIACSGDLGDGCTTEYNTQKCSS